MKNKKTPKIKDYGCKFGKKIEPFARNPSSCNFSEYWVQIENDCFLEAFTYNEKVGFPPIDRNIINKKVFKLIDFFTNSTNIPIFKSLGRSNNFEDDFDFNTIKSTYPSCFYYLKSKEKLMSEVISYGYTNKVYFYSMYPELVNFIKDANKAQVIYKGQSQGYLVSFSNEDDFEKFIYLCDANNVELKLFKVIVQPKDVVDKFTSNFVKKRPTDIIISEAKKYNSYVRIGIKSKTELDISTISSMLKEYGSSGKISKREYAKPISNILRPYYPANEQNIYYSFLIKENLMESINILKLYGIDMLSANFQICINVMYECELYNEFFGE